MSCATRRAFACAVLTAATLVGADPSISNAFSGIVVSSVDDVPQRIDLAEYLAKGKLLSAGREITKLQGADNPIHVAEGGGPVVWIAGTEFSEGTIEIDIRGRDVFQRSFVGIAFHRRDDSTYEAVYLRPFNFRAEDPIRRGHAVQYIAPPQYHWQQLRQQFPEEFENPVDSSLDPTGFVPLRVVVKGQAIEVYVGRVASPTLAVRKLGQHNGGMIGLWMEPNSDAAFANLRITPMK